MKIVNLQKFKKLNLFLLSLSVPIVLSNFILPALAFERRDSDFEVFRKKSQVDLNNADSQNYSYEKNSDDLAKFSALKKENTELKNLKQKIGKNKRTYIEDEILVKYKNIDLGTSSGKNAALRFVHSKSLETKEDLVKGNMSVLKIKDKKTVEEKIAELKNNSNIEYAQPNFQYEPLAISSNDINKNNLWALDNNGQTINGIAGTTDADIDAPEAWMLNDSPNASIIVAVIDTGVAYNHPDLLSNMWNGASCKNENGVYLGGCNHGYDYENGDKTPLPTSSSHGTHIAGTIAAVKNNTSGIIGVAPNAKIMAIKTSLTTADNVKSINFAQQNGAKIINASWGRYGIDEFDDVALYDAIANFSGLFVAAAGNAGFNHDDGIEAHKSYPDGFSVATAIGPGLNNIITVAATDQNDNLASFSDYGATSVDVGAPGTNIYSAVSGSSMYGTTVLDESFSGVTPPSVPINWIKSGTNNRFGSYALDSGSNWGKVLYGDLDYPYANNSNTLLTSPKYNLTASGANIDFWAGCDSEYDPYYWVDYMQLEYSADGISFLPAIDPDTGEEFRWDEATLDYLKGNPSDDTGGVVYHYKNVAIPAKYLTSNFKFRFRWVSDVGDNYYDGCFVDDVVITKYTDGLNGGYDYANGTSMAAPHVAGTAAYLLSYNSTLRYDQIKDVILETGDPLSSLNGKTISGKRVNMFKALDSITVPVLKAITPIAIKTPDNTPSYTFSSSEGGAITYEGDCSSETINAVKGNNVITFNTLGYGTHTNCTIRVADTFGNASSNLTVSSFTIQSNIFPVLSQIMPIPVLTNNPTPSYTFKTTKPGTITYGGPCTSATTTALAGENTIVFNPLISGAYSTCTIKIVDYELQQSNILTVKAFRIDTILPVIKQITAVPSSTRDTTPNYTFYSNEIGAISYEGDCSSVASAVSIVGNVTATFNTLIEGLHNNCKIRVTDKAGNQSAALNVNSFNIDLTPPNISEAVPVKNPTNDTTPNFTFTSNEAGKITYGGGCTSTKLLSTLGDNVVTLNALLPKTYSLCTIKVTDTAGNAGNTLAVSAFKIDTVLPVVTRIAPVPVSTNDTTPSYTFSTTKAGKISYAGDCASSAEDVSTGVNTITFNELATGLHANCVIKVTDIAGNRSAAHAVNSFAIATGEFPIIAEATPIPSRINDTTPAYTFSSSKEGTISYKGSCLSTKTTAIAGENTITFNALVPGTYFNCTIQVIDKTLKPSNYLVINKFTIDTAKPVLTVKTLAPSRTSDTTPNYSFNSTKAGNITYGGDCSSVTGQAIKGVNTITLNELIAGAHSNCTIKVTDDLGNISLPLLINSFYIDLVGPVLKEVIRVPSSTNDTTPNYTFSTNEIGRITYEGSCISTKTAAIVGNNLITFNALSYNTYSDCKIRVTDTWGNISNALNVSAFILQAKILAATTSVPTITNDNTPSYSFSSTKAGPITYAGGCSSLTTKAVVGNNTVTFKPLVDGTYDHCVIKLFDSSGVLINTLPVRTFSVDTKAPLLSEVSSVTSPTEDVTPGYTFNTNEVGTIIYSGACSSETGSAVKGDNAIIFDELELGAYDACKISVRDNAGNTSEALQITPFVIHDITKPVLEEVTSVETVTEDTTPRYTFSSSEAGAITYTGACTSNIEIATKGNNEITFDELALGSYDNCKIKVKDASENSSDELIISSFTVDDLTAPILREETPVNTPTEDRAPSYTFSSSEIGTITFLGSCSSNVANAEAGDNTITFNQLEPGTYSDCQIKVLDDNENQSEALDITSFVITATP